MKDFMVRLNFNFKDQALKAAYIVLFWIPSSYERPQRQK